MKSAEFYLKKAEIYSNLALSEVNYAVGGKREYQTKAEESLKKAEKLNFDL